jgi:hypothetical protein
MNGRRPAPHGPPHRGTHPDDMVDATTGQHFFAECFATPGERPTRGLTGTQTHGRHHRP